MNTNLLCPWCPTFFKSLKQWPFFHLMPKTQMYFAELESACTFRVENFIVITMLWLMWVNIQASKEPLRSLETLMITWVFDSSAFIERSALSSPLSSKQWPRPDWGSLLILSWFVWHLFVKRGESVQDISSWRWKALFHGRVERWLTLYLPTKYCHLFVNPLFLYCSVKLQSQLHSNSLWTVALLFSSFKP